ncbi:MAG: hypothetical protein K6T81_02000 [Alicyclobacillus macrosporangiidus]|uniref:hypothetical protein n=1 Tax=Alicyclobacillus macrosporangiidus TaxID=392015 RepID=UPI0026EE0B6F|nr:hypothetical protein [Alicyclobacillus macrosporangiidus]MCL6597495.1 hypothetical protein [Alicyclobacillus macrosporangiidus]
MDDVNKVLLSAIDEELETADESEEYKRGLKALIINYIKQNNLEGDIERVLELTSLPNEEE